MSANCPICKLDVPSSLAIMKCCNYVAHAKCIKKFINDYGHCHNCSQSATEDDILSIICDPPRQQNNNTQNVGNTTSRVQEVLTALMDRFRDFRTDSPQENAQIAQIGEAFESILGENKQNNGNTNPGGPSTSSTDDDQIKESGWDMLLRIIKSKEVRYIVLAIILALLCIFFWEVIFPAGGFAQIAELISGILAGLRAYAPQMALTFLGAVKAFFSFKK
ncbi:RING-type domain-containing protein [Meloidogyne graminicola]|uniref:RING-type domain-containing protein n=1 Tax=Meloidogyne graminicola TaxID=189291 RepID=A0A8S9ZKA0_9BILA|nr:RING-type domain-containing protein [Meloidogyne graminicola]